MSTDVSMIHSEIKEGRVLAKGPICHMGESEGVEQLFNREEIFYKGKKVKIPVITGNSIRGVLRRKARDLYMEIIGSKIEDYGAYVQWFLSNGGGQAKAKLAKDKGVQGDVVDFTYEKKIRELMPYISMFGGVVDQHFIEGRLVTDRLIPYACQTQFMTGVESNLNVNSVISRQKYTTKDDSHIEGEKGLGDEEKQKRQMRYGYEYMVAGSLLHWKYKFRPFTTDLEKGAFESTLRFFFEDPVVGGNSRIGYGELFFLDFKVNEELADAHEAYVKSQAKEIKDYLEELNNRWG